MPTYEYECRSCGKAFDHFQKMNDNPLEKCPFDACDGEVHRLVSAGAGLIFKGSGFYATDYKKKTGGETPCAAAKADKCPNASACAAANKGD